MRVTGVDALVGCRRLLPASWGIASRTLNRITFDRNGGATAAERWDIGKRVRDVEVAADGALWLLEDANPGGLYRVTPK